MRRKYPHKIYLSDNGFGIIEFSINSLFFVILIWTLLIHIFISNTYKKYVRVWDINMKYTGVFSYKYKVFKIKKILFIF